MQCQPRMTVKKRSRNRSEPGDRCRIFPNLWRPSATPFQLSAPVSTAVQLPIHRNDDWRTFKEDLKSISHLKKKKTFINENKDRRY
ncbi:hypothetical protein CDAR_464111 [Caerostris darwini]|uniref:Uncharacterized protein n=1 Tax=Caerostris darwini TaxID=1538125 RepID=A0AAV4VV87_9ARAC|nr:hypothetical protein CDAR_464111 [Caerostris darwini]